jgi:hypothetical protein
MQGEPEGMQGEPEGMQGEPEGMQGEPADEWLGRDSIREDSVLTEALVAGILSPAATVLPWQ